MDKIHHNIYFTSINKYVKAEKLNNFFNDIITEYSQLSSRYINGLNNLISQLNENNEIYLLNMPIYDGYYYDDLDFNHYIIDLSQLYKIPISIKYHGIYYSLPESAEIIKMCNLLQKSQYIIDIIFSNINALILLNIIDSLKTSNIKSITIYNPLTEDRIIYNDTPLWDKFIELLNMNKLEKIILSYIEYNSIIINNLLINVENNQYLYDISLERCDLSPYFLQTLFKSLISFKNIKNYANSKKLIIRQDIDEYSMVELKNALINNPNISNLVLHCQALSLSADIQLAKALEVNTVLTSLEIIMDGRAMPVSPISHTIQAISSNLYSNISALHIATVKLTSNDNLLINNMIKDNRLVELSIAHKKQKFFKAFVDNLKNNTSIKKLNYDYSDRYDGTNIIRYYGRNNKDESISTAYDLLDIIQHRQPFFEHLNITFFVNNIRNANGPINYENMGRVIINSIRAITNRYMTNRKILATSSIKYPTNVGYFKDFI